MLLISIVAIIQFVCVISAFSACVLHDTPNTFEEPTASIK